MIHYSLSFDQFHRHEIDVVLLFTATETSPILQLPAWIPGSYMIRDFARNITHMELASENQRLVKLNKQQWQVVGAKPGDSVEIHYSIYAYDLSVRSAYVDHTRVFFNGTSVLLRVSNSDVTPINIDLLAVQENKHWRVATALPAVSIDTRGFGRYVALDYRQAIDCPVEIADFVETAFHIGTTRHRMVFTDACGLDVERVGSQVKRICTEHAAMFGELPVQEYLFLTLATADGYGGLEHRDSTSLICRRKDLPYKDATEITQEQQTFLALCSHEYFHLWNVKRIRPQVLSESDLLEEAYTELLWWFEGATSYYDELALPRAGVISPMDYCTMLAHAITRYLRNPGRHRQSVAESSFDAWTKFYKQDENALNAIVSYYNKGALVVLGLDHWIRLHSKDALCLDDLTRLLWQRYGKVDLPVKERCIEPLVQELVGVSPDAFFSDYVYGTKELPIKDWLADFGIALSLRPARGGEDRGGVTQTFYQSGDDKLGVTLGAHTKEENGLLRIARVLNDGAAEQAGLAAGDILVAIGRERATASNLDQLLKRFEAGEQTSISYFRRDLLQKTHIHWLPMENDTADLWWVPDDQLDSTVVERRSNWLASSQVDVD